MPYRTLPMPPNVAGRVFLHSMPGRYEPWESALASLEEWGITLIACFVDGEERSEKSPEYARAVNAGLLPCTFTEHPISDYGVPDDTQAFAAYIQSLADAVRAGDSILIHCAAGVGRTGMAATCLLVALGTPLAQAHATVRAARCGAETPSQNEFLVEFSRGLE